MNEDKWFISYVLLFCTIKNIRYVIFIKQNVEDMHNIQYYWNKRSGPYWIQRISFPAWVLMWRPSTLHPSPQYSCGKRNPLYPIRATSFVSIIMYLTCTIIVFLKKTNGMAFNPTTTLKLIYWFIYHQSVVHFKTMSSIISLCTSKPDILC